MTLPRSDDSLMADLAPTRSSLLARLKDWGDDRSWAEFYDTYGRLIFHWAQQAGLAEADAREVVQETVLAAAKTMPRFRYDPAVCSFKGWLLYLTRCRITDHLRKQERRVPTVSEEEDSTRTTGLLERQPDLNWAPPAADWEADWERNLFEAALDRVRSRVKPLLFQAFQLCALNGQKPRTVAQALDVSVATVYLAKHRVTRLLRKEVADLKARWGA